MRIICTRNKAQYKNGSMGTVIRLNKRGISVMLDNGNRVAINQDERYGLPVNIAYALTVHRVQGMTLDRVNIVADDFFEAGQAYVALTRCTSREGMRIIGEIKSGDIRANADAVAWMQDNVPVLEEEEEIER